MKLFSKKPLAVATAAVLGLGMAGAAHAAAIAFANLNIFNLKVFDGLTGAQITFPPTGYFTNFGVLNTASNTAILNGVADVQSTGPTGGSISSSQACVHVGLPPCPVPYTISPLQPNFARADSVLTGSILAPGGETAQAVAEVQPPTPGAGQSSAIVGTSITFTAAPGANGVPLQFTFDATGGLVVDPGPGVGSSASASMAFSINLTDLNAPIPPTLSYAPPELNINLSRTSPGCNTYPVFVCPPLPALPVNLNPFPPFTATSLPLIGGHNYVLTIDPDVSASASDTQVVPEPTTLALLGAGLLGIGGIRRFRKTA